MGPAAYELQIAAAIQNEALYRSAQFDFEFWNDAADFEGKEPANAKDSIVVADGWW